MLNRLATLMFIHLLLIVFGFSCTDAVEKGKPESKDQNQELIQRLYDCFNRHDWSAMAERYAEPAEFLDPSFGPETVTQSRAQISAKYKQLGQSVPDIKDEVVRIFSCGENKVVVEFVSSGTGQQGKAWKLPICSVYTLENGLITKDHTYYNNCE